MSNHAPKILTKAPVFKCCRSLCGKEAVYEIWLLLETQPKQKMAMQIRTPYHSCEGCANLIKAEHVVNDLLWDNLVSQIVSNNPEQPVPVRKSARIAFRHIPESRLKI